MSWIITNFSYDISKLIIELVFLFEEELLNFSIGLIIVNERHENFIENVKHVFLFEADDDLVDWSFAIEDFLVNVFNVFGLLLA